jgi:hypothetical protein
MIGSSSEQASSTNGVGRELLPPVTLAVIGKRVGNHPRFKGRVRILRIDPCEREDSDAASYYNKECQSNQQNDYPPGKTTMAFHDLRADVSTGCWSRERSGGHGSIYSISLLNLYCLVVLFRPHQCHSTIPTIVLICKTFLLTARTCS